jgi:cell surface protein SprA
MLIILQILMRWISVGYSKKQSSSFIAGLLAAYSGSDASVFHWDFQKFPNTNWAVKYSGLMRYGLFKRNFKRFSLQHNYRAFIPSINIDLILIMIKPDGVDASGNFFNKTIMSNVNLWNNSVL